MKSHLLFFAILFVLCCPMTVLADESERIALEHVNVEKEKRIFEPRYTLLKRDAEKHPALAPDRAALKRRLDLLEDVRQSQFEAAATSGARSELVLLKADLPYYAYCLSAVEDEKSVAAWRLKQDRCQKEIERLTKIIAALPNTTASATQKKQDLSPPQLFKIASVQRQRGEIHLAMVTVRFVSESKPRAMVGDDKIPMIKFDKLRSAVYETRVSTITLENARFYAVDGKELNSVDVWERAIPGAVTAVSTDGKPIDSTYRTALAEKTLIIVSPEFAANNELQRVTR